MTCLVLSGFCVLWGMCLRIVVRNRLHMMPFKVDGLGWALDINSAQLDHTYASQGAQLVLLFEPKSNSVSWCFLLAIGWAEFRSGGSTVNKVTWLQFPVFQSERTRPTQYEAILTTNQMTFPSHSYHISCTSTKHKVTWYAEKGKEVIHST